MSEAIKEYLKQFYENPNTIEDYKINLLKNHYYPIVKNVLDCSFNQLKIGTTKNKNTIWFTSSKNLEKELIYDSIKNEYYLRFDKNLNDLIKVNLDDYNKTENNKTKTSKTENNKINLFPYLLKCLIQ